jgi:hypothetical protein
MRSRIWIARWSENPWRFSGGGEEGWDMRHDFGVIRFESAMYESVYGLAVSGAENRIRAFHNENDRYDKEFWKVRNRMRLDGFWRKQKKKVSLVTYYIGNHYLGTLKRTSSASNVLGLFQANERINERCFRQVKLILTLKVIIWIIHEGLWV